jgi:hypothetical protein
MSFGDASERSTEFQPEQDEINRKYRGASRKARLIIAEMKYGLALIEGKLGHPSVRENWERHIEKIWRARRDPETQAREALLHAVTFADQNFTEPTVGWTKPRQSFMNYLGRDAKGELIPLRVALPYETEAAKKAIESVARFDPENAARIPVAGLAAIISIFADRHRNAGRRGKPTNIDEELCKLVRAMGLTAVTPQAMRRQRTKFEAAINQRRREEVRARHLEALELERITHRLRAKESIA